MVNGYLFDSNHASALLDMKIELADAAYPDIELFVPATVVAELWFMVFKSKRMAFNEARVRRFLSQFRQIPFGSEIAAEYGLLRAELTRAGKPIPLLDVQIAATARHMNLIVLTADHHFSFVERLLTENWLA